MAAEVQTVTAYLREGKRKSETKRLRKEGFIPAILYGKRIENAEAGIPIKVPVKEMRKVDLQGAHYIQLLVLNDSGEEVLKTLAIIKDVQVDPLRPRVLHVDFQGVSLEDRVTVMVPIAVIGQEESIGIKQGGVLQLMMKEIELEVPVGKIPERIDVDISKLEIGDALHVGELQLDPDYRPVDPPDTPVLSILPPEVEETEEAEAEATAT